MMYSFRVEQAIRAAAILHRDQVRKGKVPYPYITHLFSVATLVSDFTDDEDTFIAALLHDTLEDTDYTHEELASDFGDGVAQTVRKVTHTAPVDAEEENPWINSWKARHARYIAQLKEASEPALIISAADKIHNMRSVIEEYLDDHRRFDEDFGGSLDERLANFQAISNILNSRLKNEIVQEFNHVFDQYKDFINAAQKTIEKN